jgi:hypothetical protein
MDPPPCFDRAPSVSETERLPRRPAVLATASNSLAAFRVRVDAAIAQLGLIELSPVLTLIDGMLDHHTPVLAPPLNPDTDGQTAILSLAQKQGLYLRFLSQAYVNLQQVVALLGLSLRELSSTGDALLVIVDCECSQPLSRGHLHILSDAIDRHLVRN